MVAIRNNALVNYGDNGSSSFEEEDTMAVIKELSFSYGDASPGIITIAGPGKIIYRVGLHIIEPFNGVGASITIGDAVVIDKLMKGSETNILEIGSSETSPALFYNSSTPLLLSIVPGAGATQGAGLVTIHIER